MQLYNLVARFALHLSRNLAVVSNAVTRLCGLFPPAVVHVWSSYILA